jgi:hypothetical protein
MSVLQYELVRDANGLHQNIETVYLDYTEPDHPRIIHPQNTAAVDTEYDELTEDSTVVFEAVQVSARAVSEVDEWHCIGLAGTPEWLQTALVPVCPKSGKPMRFLCQLMSFGEIKVASTNVQSFTSYMQQYFETLNFWGDGSLYVYIEPDSKVVCYTMQNT